LKEVLSATCILIKIKTLIMSIFHSVPGVPLIKMERFAGVDTQICASPQRGCPKDFYEGDGFGVR
jgi:hypothetical protein